MGEPRRRSHEHGGRPCPFATKKACNESMKVWRASQKSSEAEVAARKAREERERREQAFLDYEAKERAREQKVLRWARRRGH